MRLLKVALVSVLIIVLGWFVMAPHNDAKAADPCTIVVSGNTASVTCAGVPVGNVQLPTVKVTQTLPPLPRATDIIKVPGKTKTVYVHVPGPTKTKIVTKTVIKHSKPRIVKVPELSEHETVTRQPAPNHAMIGPATPLSAKPKIIDFGDGHTTVVEAGIGIVATLALIGLLLLMYYAGYTFGFREADSKNARFIRDVLDQNAR